MDEAMVKKGHEDCRDGTVNHTLKHNQGYALGWKKEQEAIRITLIRKMFLSQLALQSGKTRID